MAICDSAFAKKLIQTCLNAWHHAEVHSKEVTDRSKWLMSCCPQLNPTVEFLTYSQDTQVELDNEAAINNQKSRHWLMQARVSQTAVCLSRASGMLPIAFCQSGIVFAQEELQLEGAKPRSLAHRIWIPDVPILGGILFGQVYTQRKPP